MQTIQSFHCLLVNSQVDNFAFPPVVLWVSAADVGQRNTVGSGGQGGNHEWEERGGRSLSSQASLAICGRCLGEWCIVVFTPFLINAFLFPWFQVVCQHILSFAHGVQSLNATVKGAQLLAAKCIHTGIIILPLETRSVLKPEFLFLLFALVDAIKYEVMDLTVLCLKPTAWG